MSAFPPSAWGHGRRRRAAPPARDVLLVKSARAVRLKARRFSNPGRWHCMFLGEERVKVWREQ